MFITVCTQITTSKPKYFWCVLISRVPYTTTRDNFSIGCPAEELYIFIISPYFINKTLTNSERGTFVPPIRVVGWIKERSIAISAMYSDSIQYLLRIHRVSWCPGIRYRLYEHKAIIVGTTAVPHSLPTWARYIYHLPAHHRRGVVVYYLKPSSRSTALNTRVTSYSSHPIILSATIVLGCGFCCQALCKYLHTTVA